MDQCKRCTLMGDLKACQLEDCSYHELWYVACLNTRIRDLTRALKNIRQIARPGHKRRFIGPSILHVTVVGFIGENTGHIPAKIPAKTLAIRLMRHGDEPLHRLLIQ